MSTKTSAWVCLLGLSIAASTLSFTGCSSDGGDDDADGGSSGNTSVAAACEDLAESVCTKLLGCVNTEFVDSEYDCAATSTKACTAEYSGANSNVTGEDVLRCKSAYTSASCTEATTGQVRCDFPAGEVDNGSPCRRDSECESKFCARGGDKCGTCAVPPKEGEDCIQFACGPDLTCAAGKCAARKQAGEGCNQEADTCAGGLSCVKGVCTAPVESEGADCDSSGRNAPNCNLLKGLYCGQDTNKCRKVSVAKRNEPCGLLDAQVISCTVSNFCNAPSSSMQGTCAARKSAGESCEGDQCVQGASCVDKVCVEEANITCP